MSHPATILIPQLTRTLRQTLTWIDKAEIYASERGFNADNLLPARLYPDMLPLVAQLGVACDNIKLGVSRLTGLEAPKHADDNKTWADVRARIVSVLEWLDAQADQTYDGADDRQARFYWNPGFHLQGDAYLLQFLLPNAHFHLCMAYALLRHQGVPLGKADYLGPLPWQADT